MVDIQPEENESTAIETLQLILQKVCRLEETMHRLEQRLDQAEHAQLNSSVASV